MVIYKNLSGIDYLYELAVQEGEGFGTAYEYFVRLRLLRRLLKGKQIRSILIAGLPEKYGFGLDFFVLARIYGNSVSVFDEREHILTKLKNLLSALYEKNLLDLKNIKYEKVSYLEKPGIKDCFDLAVSSCVIQRLKGAARKEYINTLFKLSANSIVFSPNHANPGHKRFTGLATITKKEIISWQQYLNGKDKSKKIGTLDMPPFPPGIKKEIIKKMDRPFIIKIGLHTLKFWCYFEECLPSFLRDRFSHIIYYNCSH